MTFVPYLSEAEIQQQVSRVAREIKASVDPANAPIFVCVLNGAFMFAADLIRACDMPQAAITFIRLKSYEGTSSTGVIKEVMGLSENLEGRDVIIIEDIVDTGITIHFLKKFIKDEGASDVRVSTLMFKPESFSRNAGMLAGRGEQMTPPEYIGMSIPDAFIIGFGMDYNEIGRNYRDIYVLDEQ